MKKYVYFYMILIFILFITACRNAEDIKLDTNQYSDQEILASLKFVGQGGLSEDEGVLMKVKNVSNKVEMITFMELTIGRRSRNCNGFGICEVRVGPWEIYGYSVAENKIILPYDADLTTITLELAEQSNLDLTQVKLAVEEAIVVNADTDTFVVEADQYRFDASIGQFGGFQLAIEE